MTREEFEARLHQFFTSRDETHIEDLAELLYPLVKAAQKAYDDPTAQTHAMLGVALAALTGNAMTYHCPLCAGTWTLHEPPTRDQLAIIGEHMVRHHARPEKPVYYSGGQEVDPPHELRRI